MKLENKSGILIINKPSGPTSHDMVNQIKKILKTKVGHTGTLDPLAQGVLVITVGKATKISEILTSDIKEYEAEITFGIKTDTLDIQGTVLEEKESLVDKEKILKVLNEYKKSYMQTVPKYSAVKVKGKKLYEYARNKEEVVLPKKEVTIYDIKLLDYKQKTNKTMIKFYTKVSKGTYIRSLINDICDNLNTIGTMSNLIRIKQGKFSFNNAYKIDDIEKGKYKILPINDVLDIKKTVVTDEQKRQILNGLPMDGNDDQILYLDQNGNVLAIYKQKDGKLKMWKMLYENVDI